MIQMGDEFVQSQTYLSFKLGSEMFAANVVKVCEILPFTRISNVPHAPSYMIGVINLRGSVLPVVDVREKFRLSLLDTTADTCIMVLSIEIESEPVLIGLMVDSVLEVFDMRDVEIKPPPNMGSKYKSEIILGMVKKGEEFIIIIDIDKMLAMDEVLFVTANTEEPELTDH